MGLSVRVYQNCEIADAESSDFQAYVTEPAWKDRIKNLVDVEYYKGDRVGYVGIHYPYSYHSQFREKLIKDVLGRISLIAEDGDIKWDSLPSKMPFIELIDFADNEGCIDHETSAKLYNDFKHWHKKATYSLKAYDFESYELWLSIFDNARKNGVVVFS